MYVEHYVYDKKSIHIYIYMLEMWIYIYMRGTWKVTYNQWKVIWRTKTSYIWWWNSIIYIYKLEAYIHWHCILYVELIMLQHFKAITSHLLKSREITWNHTCIYWCLCKIVHICQGHILGYVYLCLWKMVHMC